MHCKKLNYACCKGKKASYSKLYHSLFFRKLEHAKSKLNHLTQLLDIVQTAQNTTGLAQPYLQLVTNFVNDEAGSSTPSPSPSASLSSPQKNR